MYKIIYVLQRKDDDIWDDGCVVYADAYDSISWYYFKCWLTKSWF